MKEEKKMEKTKKIIILVDTREQMPWLFVHCPDVVVIRDNLDVGDYMLFNKEKKDLYSIVIEKKYLSDFISCCGIERERFENELKRMSQEKRYLIINGSLDDIYLGNFRSKINLLSVRRTLWDWTIEYNLIPIFVSSEAQGQQVAYDVFKMFLHGLEGKKSIT